MTPEELQAPPRKLGELHSSSGRPPATDTVLSLPSAQNPMRLLSGDQNGSIAPSAPSMRRELSVSRERTQSWVSGLIGLPTTKAAVRPSGEISTCAESG